jgi:PAS domain S-box-containing protein
MDQDGRIELNAARLRKLSDQAPGAIYQLEMSPDGRISFPFISKGFTDIHPNLDPEELKHNAEVAFSVVYPDDLELVKESLQESFLNLTKWSIEYRVFSHDGSICWHWANAKPERKEDGTVVWYGTFQDITERKEYIKTLERILFDISHVMRRPVATMLGLTAAIEIDSMDEKTLKQFAGYLKVVSEEMDAYIKKLNEDYSKTMLKVAGHNKGFKIQDYKQGS